MDKRQAVSTSLKPASEKWESIASGIGLQADSIEKIEDKYHEPGRCLNVVINNWFNNTEQKYKKLTWRSVVNVLRSPTVNESNLADQIKSTQGFSKVGTKKQEEHVSQSQCNVKGASHDIPQHVSSQVHTDTFPKQTEAPDLKSLLTSTKAVVEWYNLGLELDIHAHVLNAIEKDHPNQSEVCKRKMLQCWLDTGSASWQKLIDALKSPLLNLCGIANEIAIDHPTISHDIPQHVSTQNGKDTFAGTSAKTGSDDHCLTLESYLRLFYLNTSKHNEKDWPLTNVKLIDANLLLHEELDTLEFSDQSKQIAEYSKQGKVDRIIRNNQGRYIALERIADFHQSRKVIVIEGAPGIGKTTLANEICRKWARNISFNEFSLVVYIPLQSPLVRLAESIDDLIKYYGDHEFKHDIKFILDTLGKDVLFILDGWDELRKSCRDDDMFYPSFIRGKYLPNCSIIITSRQSAVTEIRKHSNRLLTIVGFTEEQVKEFIRLNLEDGAEELIQELKDFPNVMSTCYVAINLTIICFVYKAEKKLPPTLTEIYEQFVLHAVKRHAKKGKMIVQSNVLCEETDALVKFDKYVNDILNSLGQLALNGIGNHDFSFSKTDLQNACHVDESEAEFDGFGLLQFYQITRRSGPQSFCYFLHLTVQEFLAAYSLFHMEEKNQGDWLLNVFGIDRYEFVVKFFCGLNKFQSRPSRSIICNDKQLVNSLITLECIYEAQCESMCEKVAEKRCCKLVFETQIQPYQALVYGYVMVKSKSTGWELHWEDCNIEEHQLRILCQYIQYSPEILKKVAVIKSSVSSPLSANLFSQIISAQNISELTLSDIQLSEESFLTLLYGCCSHRTLAMIRLQHFTLTETSSQAVVSILAEAKALHCLDASECKFDDSCHHNIIRGLMEYQELHLPQYLKDEVHEFIQKTELKPTILYK